MRGSVLAAGCETVLRKMGGLLRSAGGCRNASASVEVYDPATGEWSDVKHAVPEGLDAEGRDVYELDRVEQPSERYRALKQLAEAGAAVGLERSESSTHLGYCRGAFGFLEQHRRQVCSSRFKQLNSPR